MSSTRSTRASTAAPPATPEEPPFPGPRPFSSKESGDFFGRANEVAELASLVRSHAAVLLYAESGAGKSSLVEAGVRPRLENRFGAAVMSGRVKGPLAAPGVGSGNVYVENLLRSMGLTPDAAAPRLADCLRSADWADKPLRVIVIDQLEEVFSLFPERWRERRDFFEQIQDALDTDRLLRFLLVVRADYLTRLHPFTSAFSDDLRSRYGLERLRRSDAVDAVTLPGAGSSRRFSSAAADALVGELLAIPSETPGGPPATGEFVDPGELQIVCRDIWQRVPPGEITPDQVRRLARLDEVHGRFYDRAVKETVGATGFDERKLRRWFGGSLITAGGTRGFLFRDATHTGGLPNAVVDALEQQQVIRAERRGNSQWYELTHDRLVAAVVDSNRRWFRQRASTQRLRWAVLGSVLVATVLCVALALALRSPGTVVRASVASLSSLGQRGIQQGQAGDGATERIPFTATGGTEAILSVGPDAGVSEPWDLRLFEGDREIPAIARGVAADGTASMVAALPVDGTYEVEVGGGGDGSAYLLTGEEVLRVPLADGGFGGSGAPFAPATVHPLRRDEPGVVVITVTSVGSHTVSVLAADGSYIGGPDFEEPNVSHTVLTFPGDYLLKIAMDEAGTYSLRAGEPVVERITATAAREASIDGPGELDVYRFDPPVGQVALIRMRSTELTPVLGVFTPDGLPVEVFQVADAAGSSSAFVAFVVTADGPHYCVATAEGTGGNASTGSYRLTYSTGQLPP